MTHRPSRHPFRNLYRLTHRRRKIGLPPGSIVPHPDAPDHTPRIQIIDYDKSNLNVRSTESAEKCFPLRNTDTVSWINVDGSHDPELIRRFGDGFDLHPLVLEDIATTGQRPKVEVAEHYIFVVLSMLRLENGSRVLTEQISIVIGDQFVLSFQETPGDVFDSIRKRLKNESGRLRSLGADYLAYALIDTIVDNYFLIGEHFSEEIYRLEEELLADPDTDLPHRINGLRREVVLLRKATWPLREVISNLERADSPLIREDTRPFLRDVYDHTIQVVDLLQTLRDLLTGLLDVYLSTVSNRMNQIMKVLTIMGSIFIPLTFIAGIYGMNFEHMPELNWTYGYPIALGLMATVALGLIAFFRSRNWF